MPPPVPVAMTPSQCALPGRRGHPDHHAAVQVVLGSMAAMLLKVAQALSGFLSRIDCLPLKALVLSTVMLPWILKSPVGAAPRRLSLEVVAELRAPRSRRRWRCRPRRRRRGCARVGAAGGAAVAAAARRWPPVAAAARAPGLAAAAAAGAAACRPLPPVALPPWRLRRPPGRCRRCRHRPGGGRRAGRAKEEERQGQVGSSLHARQHTERLRPPGGSKLVGNRANFSRPLRLQICGHASGSGHFCGPAPALPRSPGRAAEHVEQRPHPVPAVAVGLERDRVASARVRAAVLGREQVRERQPPGARRPQGDLVRPGRRSCARSARRCRASGSSASTPARPCRAREVAPAELGHSLRMRIMPLGPVEQRVRIAPLLGRR